jgi:hypothetical protein
MGVDPADIVSYDSLERIAELVTDERDDLGFAAFSSPSVGVGVSGSYRFSEHGPVVPLYYELRDSDFNVGTALSGSYMDQYRNYVDLYINHSVVSAEDSVGRTLEDAQREFMEGKALFHQDGSWSAEKLEEALADKYAVIPLYMGMPGEEDQGLNETCSYYWCVNKYASEDETTVTKPLPPKSMTCVIMLKYSNSSIFSCSSSIAASSQQEANKLDLEAKNKAKTNTNKTTTNQTTSNSDANNRVFQTEGEEIDDEGYLVQYLLKGSNNSYVIGLENRTNANFKLCILLEGLDMLDSAYKGQSKPTFTIKGKERKVFNVRIKQNYSGNVSFQFEYI